MPLQPTTTADNNDFNMISELNTSSLTPTQLKTGIEKGYALSSLVSTPTQIDGKVIPIDTIALLRVKTVTPSTVWVSGYYAKGDGAFGSNIFEWDSTSTETDNGGTIIKLTSITTGRYKLRFSGAVNVKWFGDDDTVATKKAISTRGGIFFQKGFTSITEKIQSPTLPSNDGFIIHGEGMASTDPILYPTARSRSSSVLVWDSAM